MLESDKRISFSDAFRLAIAFGAVAAAIALFLSLRDIFITFLAAIIFAIALDKPIDRLAQKNVPRAVSAIIIYLVFLIFLGLSLYVFLPTFASEIRNFAITFPIFLESFFEPESAAVLPQAEQLELSQYLRAISDAIGASSQTIVGTIFKIFGGFISFLVIFFVSLFFNIQKDGVRRIIFVLVPKEYRSYANTFFDKIQKRVTSWLWGKSLSSLLVGFVIYIGLAVINIPYALVLAVLAALLNFIPFIGPIIASIPAALLGFTISISHGLAVIGLFVLANMIIESFILMPLFMTRAVKMNPALLILFVMIGGRVAGVLGIIISVPVAAIVSLAIEEFFFNEKAAFKE